MRTWLVVCLLARPLAADLAFDTWTVRDGLPQGSVYDIVQTRDGYLWLATLGGLVRFDGVHFIVFEKANAPGIASNRFMTLFEDRDGALWAGTEDGGVTRYAGGRFRTYSHRDGLPHDRVRAIDQDERGAILVLTDRGIARMSGERFERLSVAAEMPLNPEATPGVARHAGISLRDRDGLHTFFRGRHHAFHGLGEITSRYLDQQGTLWGFRGHDAALFRIAGGTATRHVPPQPIPLAGKNVVAVHEDRQRNLWISVDGEGVTRIGRDGITQFTAENGLAGPAIAAIFEDREGNLWMGSLLAGLSRFRHRVVTNISKRDGLPDDNIYPLLQTRSGDVLVGMWGSGLCAVRHGKVDPRSHRLGGTHILSLLEDRSGAIWAGGAPGSGLVRIEGDRVVPVALDDRSHAVSVLHQDRRGVVWAGTGGGLIAFLPGGARRYGMREGLPHADVRAIVEEPDGTMWIGTRGGVARFDGRRFRIFSEREGLSSNHVRALHRDVAGAIWVGTYDGGLNRIAKGRITVVQKKDGLFDNGVFAIVDDGLGHFWMTSNRGIYRTRQADLNEFAAGRRRIVHSVGYGVEDGMLSPDCNGNAQPPASRTSDGQLWFPTQRGIAVIDPARLRTNTAPPPVVIETVTADDASYPGGPALEMPRGTRRMRIDYTALSFIKPEQMRFRSRLEGLEGEWVEAGTQRTAFYTHLPPGRYVFRVVAANSDGVWNERGATMAIAVLPPFWRTPWFFTLAVIAGATALLALHYWRVRRLERERAAEQSFLRRLMLSEEAERTRIAAELHDSLGQSLMVISNRAIMAKRDAERGRPFDEHLARIAETTLQAADEVREIAHNLHPQLLERLGLTRALHTMLDRARTASTLEIGGEIEGVDGLLRPELELSFYRLAQEALTNVLRHADARRASVVVRRQHDRIALTVNDDGRGFDASDAGSAGLGLMSMRQRVTILGGTLRIQSRRGAGTLVQADIPLPEGERDV